MTDLQKRTALYESITTAAKQHGEDSEPDHEVGDLQNALEAAIDLMTARQVEALREKLIEQEIINS